MITIKKYFMWAGGTVILLTIVLSALSGLYSDYFYCKSADLGDEPIPGATVTQDQLRDMETRMMCNNVGSNLYMSHLVIVIGAALLIGGFITRK